MTILSIHAISTGRDVLYTSATAKEEARMLDIVGVHSKCDGVLAAASRNVGLNNSQRRRLVTRTTQTATVRPLNALGQYLLTKPARRQCFNDLENGTGNSICLLLVRVLCDDGETDEINVKSNAYMDRQEHWKSARVTNVGCSRKVSAQGRIFPPLLVRVHNERVLLQLEKA